ncbi:MAG: copper ion binding protein [Acidimicrobiales bacterium]|nr:copper ion binding protein [Acidimicrobiales bacterium]
MADLTVTVQGMTCDHCVRAVTDAVTELDGVDDVAVDLDQGRVDVTGPNVDEPAVRDAIVEAGYEPVA